MPRHHKGIFKVSYIWECPGVDDMPPAMKEQLDDLARGRVRYFLKEGLREGELNEYLSVEVPGQETPESGWHCFGYLTIEY